MDAPTADASIKAFVPLMRERLQQALSIAVAAEACSAAGNHDKAIEIILDVEQLIYEVTTLLNAASLINRLGDS